MAKLVIGTDKTVAAPALVKMVPVQEKYPLLSRVKDDSNNEIGTVCGYHTDANNQKYAVVALDAQYRLFGQYLSRGAEVTGLALLHNQTLWDNTDTATSNCTKILDFIDGTEYVSSAVTHCRSLSFVVEGTTYYGQLPTIVELTDVFRHRTAINNADTSATGQYSSLIVPIDTTTWSSSQHNSNNGWCVTSGGNTNSAGKYSYSFVLPILEIPID